VTIPATTPTTDSAAAPARTRERVGTWALWIAAAALLASPAALAFDSGGSGVAAQAVAATCAFALLAAVAVLAPWPLVERSWPLAALAALVALAAWTGASASWSSALGDAVNDADRLVLYAAAFAIGVAVMRDRRVRGLAPDALLLGVLVVAVYALAGRLAPDVVETTLSSFAGDRLSEPLRYWNALGLVTGTGVVLAVAVAGNEARPAAYRALACAAAVPCGLACALTFSRGAWVAALAGLAVCLLARPRRSAALAAALAGAGLAVTGVALALSPAVLHLDRGEASQASQGHVLATVVVVAAVAAAVAFARLAGVDRLRGAVGLPRAFRAVALAAIVPVALGLAAAVALRAERTEAISKSASRVTTLKTYRGDYWEAALDAFADHPVAGAGTASFRVEWRRRRTSSQFALDAHSLYVETLAELGLVGLLLLAAFGGSVVGGLRRRFREAPDDALLAAAAGALAAYAVHAGVDWDWELPAATLPALLLAAAAIQRPDPAPPARAEPAAPGESPTSRPRPASPSRPAR
jgi:hypothetical protein